MKITIRQVDSGDKLNLLPMNLQQGLVLTKENVIIAAYSEHANRIVFLDVLGFRDDLSSSDVIEFLEENQLIDCNAANYNECMSDSFGLDYWNPKEDEHSRV